MKNLIPIIITFSIFSIIILVTVGFQSCQDEISGTEIKPLTVGDQMPTISATISINALDNRETLKTSSDKLIILEFIDTHCSVSRETIPHLQRLQQTFKDDLTIILVTQQKDSLIRVVADQYQWTLPIITEDTVLSRCFPYEIVPHQVWIRNRKIVAITDWQYANEKNIGALLSGKSVSTHLKKDHFLEYTEPKLPQPLYMSAITPSVNSGSAIYKNNDHLLISNMGIPELFRYAFNRPSYPIGAYVRLEVSDSLLHLLTGPKSQITGNYQEDSIYFDWLRRYTFCYQLKFPEGSTMSSSDIQKVMQRDLNNFFTSYIGLSGSIQKRNLKCLVLKNINPSAYKASEGESKDSNESLESFIRQVAYQNKDLAMPIVDATGYSGSINLDIKDGLDDLEKVNESLENYGLQFVEQDHELEIVVLQEIPPTN